jgi:hypothetical protein
MDSIYLKYGAMPLPILADRNGEAVSNWVQTGNHHITADATHVHSGTKSYKLNSIGVGDFSSNYDSLPSGNNATFVVGAQYCITIWAYATSAYVFLIKTGGVTSASLTCTANTWIPLQFVFTAATATTALQIATANICDIWFELEPIYQCVQLNILSEKGMSDPDMFDFFPAIQNAYIDGGMEDLMTSFRRKIVVDCGVVAVRSDRLGILYWMIDKNRTVDYLTETSVPVCLQDVSGYSNEWKEDCSLMRAFTLALQEPVVRTTFPV